MMFKYRGCKGEKVQDFDGGFVWNITYEDGTKDMALCLELAILLCEKKVLRARL
jgi:hypothetical protein